MRAWVQIYSLWVALLGVLPLFAVQTAHAAPRRQIEISEYIDANGTRRQTGRDGLTAARCDIRSGNDGSSTGVIPQGGTLPSNLLF